MMSSGHSLHIDWVFGVSLVDVIEVFI